MLALDRELVSFPRKTTVIPKLLVALFVGMVISAPLELKVFASRINEELALTREQQSKAILDGQSQADGLYEAKINSLQRNISEYRDGMLRSMEAITAEVLGRPGGARTAVAGQGPVYREAERLKDNYQRLLTQAEMQLEDLQEARQKEFDLAKSEASLRSQNMADDLLARREALGRIQLSSRTGLYTVWGFRLLIVLIQILPIMLHLLMPANDYMAVVV